MYIYSEQPRNISMQAYILYHSASQLPYYTFNIHAQVPISLSPVQPVFMSTMQVTQCYAHYSISKPLHKNELSQFGIKCSYPVDSTIQMLSSLHQKVAKYILFISMAFLEF